jgi:hypothetical protein
MYGTVSAPPGTIKGVAKVTVDLPGWNEIEFAGQSFEIPVVESE